MTGLACPICHNAMPQTKRDGVTIDVCFKHGIWLDKSELLTLTEAERHRNHGLFANLFSDAFRTEMVPGVDPDRVLQCPQCHKDMVVDKYQGVHLDWCHEHGIFLDNGELEAMLNNLRLDPLFVRGVALRLSEGKY